MALVSPKKIHILDAEQLGLLDAIYRERNQPRASPTDELINALPFGDLK